MERDWGRCWVRERGPYCSIHGVAVLVQRQELDSQVSHNLFPFEVLKVIEACFNVPGDYQHARIWRSNELLGRVWNVLSLLCGYMCRKFIKIRTY